ncbi:MAG: hypothetical protein DSM106950_12480 [Stigonema ocellatum SAG 48.90 = DSM 106950]|nr:hypothetical protein [Stigonema ocellatum SAG 48.90 = DSM 106950]
MGMTSDSSQYNKKPKNILAILPTWRNNALVLAKFTEGHGSAKALPEHFRSIAIIR